MLSGLAAFATKENFSERLLSGPNRPFCLLLRLFSLVY